MAMQKKPGIKIIFVFFAGITINNMMD